MRRRHRLRRTADINRLWRRGKRWHHPHLLLIVGPNDLDYSRFGFTISRQFGSAVTRNKSKRLLREAVRKSLDDVENGWDCLFVAHSSARGRTFSEMNEAVSLLLRRAGLLNHVPSSRNHEGMRG
ncbi:MAG: ribonuclease P protein component [Candidatus Promineifilaceae bacterium]